jgi:hypothetical protein
MWVIFSYSTGNGDVMKASRTVGRVLCRRLPDHGERAANTV